jgi:hypothetical protein
MRRYIFIILLAMILAACTDDAPSDTRGCIAEEGQSADEIYDRDDGCLNGSIFAEEGHGDEDEHTEGDEEDSEDADHDEEAEDEDDHEEQDGESEPESDE